MGLNVTLKKGSNISQKGGKNRAKVFFLKAFQGIMGLSIDKKEPEKPTVMQPSNVLQIMFVCDLSKTTDTKARANLQRKMMASCVHKKINGFFLSHGNTYLGVFEGPTKKVLAQVEGLVRKDFVIFVEVLREKEMPVPEWQAWFQDSNSLVDLPADQIARTEGLAQIVEHKLNAG